MLAPGPARRPVWKPLGRENGGLCEGTAGGGGGVSEVQSLGMCVAMQEGAWGQSFVNSVNLI